MRELEVWLDASPLPIGLLVAFDDGEVDFAYTDDWLNARDNHPISLSLPLSDEPMGDVLTRDFFGNLLQENSQLDQVMEREGLARGDIVGLLSHLGADCAGAISVLALDHPPIKRPGNLGEDYHALSEEDFRDIVTRLATNKPLPDELRDPSPVAGYRPKISLAAIPGKGFAVPRPGSGAPTTHIIKIPDPDHRHEARDEAFVTLLASGCDLPVGTCVEQTLGGHDYLLIKRFDRIVAGDLVTRIHQEDFAQAAGLPATLKYQRYGSTGREFDAARIGKILAATEQPARARALFLRMTLFNLLVGNNDNHAKNHGLLHFPGRAPQLAPFYDLVPVLTSAGFRDDLSFKIGTATAADAVTRADLEHFMVELGFAPSRSGHLLEAEARGVIGALEKLAAGIPREMGAIDRQVGSVAHQLNHILGLGLDLRDRDAPIVQGGGWIVS